MTNLPAPRSDAYSYPTTRVPILQGVISGRAMDDWIAALNAASVPVGPINDLERVFADPHVKARGMQTQPQAADGTQLQGVASALNLSRTPPIAPRAARDLGADT